MDELDGDVSDVEIRFRDGNCQCEVTLCRYTDEGKCVDIHHHSGAVCTNCPGVIFDSYDLVPRFLDRDGNDFVIQTYLPLEHQLSELVSDLRTVSHEVEVLRIIDNLSGRIDEHTAEIDLTRLTDKQRETLEEALKRGYYDTPQQITLEDLAGDFGVSKSALFQRLARAEREIMTQVFGR